MVTFAVMPIDSPSRAPTALRIDLSIFLPQERSSNHVAKPELIKAPKDNLQKNAGIRNVPMTTQGIAPTIVGIEPSQLAPALLAPRILY